MRFPKDTVNRRYRAGHCRVGNLFDTKSNRSAWRHDMIFFARKDVFGQHYNPIQNMGTFNLRLGLKNATSCDTIRSQNRLCQDFRQDLF